MGRQVPNSIVKKYSTDWIDEESSLERESSIESNDSSETNELRRKFLNLRRDSLTIMTPRQKKDFQDELKNIKKQGKKLARTPSERQLEELQKTTPNSQLYYFSYFSLKTEEDEKLYKIRDKELKKQARLISFWRSHLPKELKKNIDKYMCSYDLGYMMQSGFLDRDLFKNLIGISGFDTINGYIQEYNLVQVTSYPKPQGYTEDGRAIYNEKQKKNLQEQAEKVTKDFLSATDFFSKNYKNYLEKGNISNKEETYSLEITMLSRNEENKQRYLNKANFMSKKENRIIYQSMVQDKIKIDLFLKENFIPLCIVHKALNKEFLFSFFSILGFLGEIHYMDFYNIQNKLTKSRKTEKRFIFILRHTESQRIKMIGDVKRITIVMKSVLKVIKRKNLLKRRSLKKFNFIDSNFMYDDEKDEESV